MTTTKRTVLGTLVDRAVCMPWTKPMRMNDNHHNFINAQVLEAIELLEGAFGSWKVGRYGSMAEALADPGGPWWSKTRDDFCELESGDREWVLDHLASAAEKAAERLDKRAEDFEWTWLWSQPSLTVPSLSGLPDVKRPDLVAGLSSGTGMDVAVVDLKTTSRDLDRWQMPASQIIDFREWNRRLEMLGFNAVDCGVLVVAADGLETRWKSCNRKVFGDRET